MAKQHETIKLATLIQQLEEIYRSEGNIPVVMSRDEEGNGYNTLSPTDLFSDCCSIEGGLLILYPHAERLELDEVKGYENTLDEDYDDMEDEEDDDEEDPPYGCNFDDE